MYRNWMADAERRKKLPYRFESKQDFEKLRSECLAKGTLFEDPEFPATESSLHLEQPKPYVWKRPKEIFDDPAFFVDGASRFDVKQGELGDCWMLAALACLTSKEELFRRVVPDGQSFKENYAGIFHFKFWQYDRWVDVVIDDRLPTIEGRLYFMHSSQCNELWSALLEKAYAKMYGSYGALVSGNEAEAMADFTGGVVEVYDLADNQPPVNFYNIMLKAYQRSALITCSINNNPEDIEGVTELGLVLGHAFSITSIRYVKTRTSNRVPLLRVRNPWGRKVEWRGTWSDKSEAWNSLTEETKKELGMKCAEDGEFWMSYKDFIKHFQRIEICYLCPCSLDERDLGDGVQKWWQMYSFEGEWVRGVSSGGTSYHRGTFCYNPQYTINLIEPDEEDGAECTVIVALTLKNKRRMGNFIKLIGFDIYELNDVDSLTKPLGNEFFTLQDAVHTTEPANRRDVVATLQLTVGTYLIVPWTIILGDEGKFLLRVFSGEKNHTREHDKEIKIDEGDAKVNEIEDKSEMDKLKQAFDKYSKNGSEISWFQLKKILDFLMVDNNAVDIIADDVYYPKQGGIYEFAARDNGPEDKTENPFEGFSKEDCRSMLAMLDLNRTGRLDFDEFTQLWKDIKHWKNAFKKHDKDDSGSLNGFELRRSLSGVDYEFSLPVLNVLGTRYVTDNGDVTLGDFIMCAVKLKSVISTFKKKDSNLKAAPFSLEEWVVTTLYS